MVIANGGGGAGPETPGGEAPVDGGRNSAILWKLLWDYDPNGLLVLDGGLRVILVNPAMCQMLKSRSEDLLGRPAAELLGDDADFRRALAEQREITGGETGYPRYDLYARKVIFPVPDESVVAGIFVNLTREFKQRQELENLRRQTAAEVRKVVDNQMRVAQEIAGLMGETTAETKVSLLRLLDLLRPDHE